MQHTVKFQPEGIERDYLAPCWIIKELSSWYLIEAAIKHSLIHKSANVIYWHVLTWKIKNTEAHIFGIWWIMILIIFKIPCLYLFEFSKGVLSSAALSIISASLKLTKKKITDQRVNNKQQKGINNTTYVSFDA